MFNNLERRQRLKIQSTAIPPELYIFLFSQKEVLLIHKNLQTREENLLFLQDTDGNEINFAKFHCLSGEKPPIA